MIVVRVFSEVSGKEICHDTIYSGCMSDAEIQAKRFKRMKDITAEIEVTEVLQHSNVT
jgi:hypothetical protein